MKIIKRYTDRNLCQEKGYAMMMAMMLIVVMGAILTTYHLLTSVELASIGASARQEKSFYSAEAALNVRIEDFRKTFNNYNMPTGTPPSTTNPCVGGNNGSGDFRCIEYTFGNNTIQTYVVDNAGNPTRVTIPMWESYGGLYAFQNRYSVFARAVRSDGSTGSILGLSMRSRSVPIYQFALFSDVTNTFAPYTMDIGGPIHMNGDFIVGCDNELNIYGSVSVSGEIRRMSCPLGGIIRMPDVIATLPYNIGMLTELNGLYGCDPSYETHFAGLPFTEWNQLVKQDVASIDVPEIKELDPVAGNNFWDGADLRFALKVNASAEPNLTYAPNTGIEVRNQNGSVNVGLTSIIDSCTNPTGASRFQNHPLAITSSASGAGNKANQMYNPAELSIITMLEVDLRSLLNCLHSNSILALDETTNDGLVLYFTVEGPYSSGLNTYGVRIANAEELAATVGGAPRPEGLTIVTNQALYTYGNYNITNKIPASLISDSYNVLSSNWNDLISHNHNPSILASGYANRIPVNTTINAAIISGTRLESGMENISRMSEDWSGPPLKTLTLLGSIITAGTPVHTNNYPQDLGDVPVGATYTPPFSNINFDPTFNTPGLLPPLTPRFTYIRQTLFDQEFEQ